MWSLSLLSATMHVCFYIFRDALLVGNQKPVSQKSKVIAHFRIYMSQQLERFCIDELNLPVL